MVLCSASVVPRSTCLLSTLACQATWAPSFRHSGRRWWMCMPASVHRKENNYPPPSSSGFRQKPLPDFQEVFDLALEGCSCCTLRASDEFVLGRFVGSHVFPRRDRVPQDVPQRGGLPERRTTCSMRSVLHQSLSISCVRAG